MKSPKNVDLNTDTSALTPEENSSTTNTQPATSKPSTLSRFFGALRSTFGFKKDALAQPAPRPDSTIQTSHHSQITTSLLASSPTQPKLESDPQGIIEYDVTIGYLNQYAENLTQQQRAKQPSKQTIPAYRHAEDIIENDDTNGYDADNESDTNSNSDDNPLPSPTALIAKELPMQNNEDDWVTVNIPDDLEIVTESTNKSNIKFGFLVQFLTDYADKLAQQEFAKSSKGSDDIAENIAPTIKPTLAAESDESAIDADDESEAKNTNDDQPSIYRH